MPKIDLAAIEQSNRTGYPAPYAAVVDGRWVRKLGHGCGLADFGISHVILKPGAASSQRHWHEDEDEFVVMLSGHAVLIEEEGRFSMQAGDMAAFPKGEPNGHQLINESDRDCEFLAFGRVPQGDAHYPDIDLRWSMGGYRRKDGSAF